MDLNADQLQQIFNDVLSERSTINQDIHRDHHTWMASAIPKLEAFLDYREVRMDEIRKRKQAIEKIRDTAVGAIVVGSVAGLISLLAWLGALVVHAFVHWIQTAPPGGG